MTLVSSKTVTAALEWRYATQEFDPARKIPAGTWEALERSLVLAPSTFGLQPWKFIMVADPSKREMLSAAAWGQRQPVDCSHFVVFAGRKDYGAEDIERLMERTAKVRGVTRDSLMGYQGAIVSSVERAAGAGTLDGWMARQVYIPLGQFMLAAALMGVDTCPMEGFDAARYDEILGLPALGYATLCACAAGYRTEADKYAKEPKVRFKDSEVIIRT